MSFMWPAMLATLLGVPALVYLYARLMQRRARRLAELGTMGIVRTSAGKPLGFRRHVPPLLFLIGITILLVGLARPRATVALPKREGTVILAFDVSASMLAEDVEPSRLEAAKRAARAFVEQQPSSIRIGVVAFGDTAFVTQAPTDMKPDVLRAIRRLKPGGGTSIAHAIVASLSAIADKKITIDPDALEQGVPQPDLPFLGSATIIMLTDGENTSPLDPIAFADVAAQAGVRIDPVGIGSARGAVVEVDGFSVATRLDEELLREVARSSQGSYFRAQDAATLRRIYETIDLKLTVRAEQTEITALFGAAGLAFAAVGGALSLRWFGRVP